MKNINIFLILSFIFLHLSSPIYAKNSFFSFISPSRPEVRQQHTQSLLVETQKELQNKFDYLTRLRGVLGKRIQSPPYTRDYSLAVSKLNQFDSLSKNFPPLLSQFNENTNQVATTSMSTVLSDIHTQSLPVWYNLQTLQKLLVESLRSIIWAPRL